MNDMKRVASFLDAVALNNNRPWFQAHRKEYDEVRALFDEFAQCLITELSHYDSTLRGLSVEQCTYRFYRDTRFSQDKSPYKRHMGVYVCRGGKKSGFSGYYFHLAAKGTENFGWKGHYLAAGDYCQDPKALRIMREDIADNPGEFEDILSQAPGYRLDENLRLKRVPRGFDPLTPAADMLRYKAYCLVAPWKGRLGTPEQLARKVAKAFAPIVPFIAFVNRAIDYVREEGA